MKTYDTYKTEVTAEVASIINDLQCQPILFVGSGFSQRYFGAPTWNRLLEVLADECPLLNKKKIAYYRQKFPEAPDCAQAFAEQYQEWAWGDGKDRFQDTFFQSGAPKQVYLKAFAAKYLDGITPKSMNAVQDERARNELRRLQAICPHAVLTTNYDCFLEVVFPEYNRVVGQQVLRATGFSVGDVFKIHGCVTTPESIILTRDDYAQFERRQKYLSAKLLTYFAEHPLLFIGYSATDPNVRAILADIDEIVATESGVIPNIFFLSWSKDPITSYPTAREELISVGEKRSVRVHRIDAHEFGWVFDAFSARGALGHVNIKAMRSLLARVYQIVRTDIPNRRVEVNYANIEAALQSGIEDTSFWGVGAISNPKDVNLQFPYTLSQVAEKLGDLYWHNSNELIKQIDEEKGVNIKASDNCYHVAFKSGRASMVHKYSDVFITLLHAVRSGNPYELDKSLSATKTR